MSTEPISQSEREILHDILAALGCRQDCRVWRVNVVVAKDASGQWMRSCPDGSADISGILRGGRRLELEVKSATGRVRPEQQAFLQMIRDHGGCAAVVRSVAEAVAAIEQGAAVEQSSQHQHHPEPAQ